MDLNKYPDTEITGMQGGSFLYTREDANGSDLGSTNEVIVGNEKLTLADGGSRVLTVDLSDNGCGEIPVNDALRYIKDKRIAATRAALPALPQ